MLQKLIKETESLEKMKGFSPNHPSLPVQYVENFLDIIEVKTCKVMRLVQNLLSIKDICFLFMKIGPNYYSKDLFKVFRGRISY